MNDMEILSEIRQIDDALPQLKLEAREAAKAYRAACAPLKPARERMNAAKAAVKAARTRMGELIRHGEA